MKILNILAITFLSVGAAAVAANTVQLPKNTHLQSNVCTAFDKVVVQELMPLLKKLATELDLQTELDDDLSNMSNLSRIMLKLEQEYIRSLPRKFKPFDKNDPVYFNIGRQIKRIQKQLQAYLDFDALDDQSLVLRSLMLRGFVQEGKKLIKLSHIGGIL